MSRRAQIAIVLTYDADKVTKEQALKDAEEVCASIVFSHYEYYPHYLDKPQIDQKYDRDSW